MDLKAFPNVTFWFMGETELCAMQCVAMDFSSSTRKAAGAEGQLNGLERLLDCFSTHTISNQQKVSNSMSPNCNLIGYKWELNVLKYNLRCMINRLRTEPV